MAFVRKQIKNLLLLKIYMIVGFNVTDLEASQEENVQGDLQINYNPEIRSVEKTSVNAFDEEVAKIYYSFSVDYEADGEIGAQIKLSGNVLWKGNTDEIVEAWDENQQLPEKINAPLMNDMYRKLISEAVGVADTLNLLPPVPTPQVK